MPRIGPLPLLLATEEVDALRVGRERRNDPCEFKVTVVVVGEGTSAAGKRIPDGTFAGEESRFTAVGACGGVVDVEALSPGKVSPLLSLSISTEDCWSPSHCPEWDPK